MFRSILNYRIGSSIRGTAALGIAGLVALAAFGPAAYAEDPSPEIRPWGVDLDARD